MTGHEHPTGACSLLDGVALPPPRRGEDTALDVIRHPAHLGSHLTRLAGATDDDAVYGALVDLFIGSEPTEQAIRRRALDEHATALGPVRRAALEAAVETGLRAADPIPAAAASRFTCGATSTRPLVSTLATPATAPAVVEPAAAPDATTAALAPPQPAAAAAAAPAWRPPRVRRRRAAVLAAAVAAAVLGLGLVVARSGEEPPDAPQAAPETSAPALSEPITSEPITSAPASTTPASTPAAATVDPVDTAAVDATTAIVAALADPTAPWDAGAFTPDSPTAAAVDDLRAALAAGGQSLTTEVDDVEVVDRQVDGDVAEVVVVVTHRGSELRGPGGPAPWAAPARHRLVVALTRSGDEWLVEAVGG